MQEIYVKFYKPVFDFSAAVFLIFVLSPLLIFLTILLFFLNKGKPFFFQERIGYREKPFTVYKFRTLKDLKDDAGKILPDSDRMYPFGTLMRISHLDELPQLFNILRGELSFIGPRPLPSMYLSHYSKAEKLRHLCKPGLAGLSQILAGNRGTWGERLKYDIFYYRHCSFSLDCFIVRKFFSCYIIQRNKSDLFCESFVDYNLRRNQSGS